MSKFLVVRQGDTERWTLTDPAARNALSDGMVVALVEACLRAKADAQLRTVVLTGAGGAFCAGGSLGHFASAIGQPLGHRAGRVHQRGQEIGDKPGHAGTRASAASARAASAASSGQSGTSLSHSIRSGRGPLAAST